MEIIAEIGQNHNGDLDLALRLIDAAKEAGADVAKFQAFDARALFPKDGNPWYEYNCRTELGRRDIETLARHCGDVGIEFMASVFDVERVGWLESVGVRRYKIASRSVRDTALVEAVAATGKPMIVSLGMWEESAFPIIAAVGGVEFLYCVAKYPAPPEDLHLGRVDFTRYAGFSDHSLGNDAARIALARGARILEKHFTVDKGMHGPDHAGSMTPDDLRAIAAFRDAVRACL